MTTNSAYHRDFHRCLRHYYQTWAVLSLDLYSRMNCSCIRDRHLSCYCQSAGDDWIVNCHLWGIPEIIQSPNPKERYSSLGDSPFHKQQEGCRALVTSHHIERTNRYLWDRCQKLKRPNLQLKKQEIRTNERFVVLLFVMKDVIRLQNKLTFFCCLFSPWASPPFLFILAQLWAIGYALGGKYGS